MKNLVIKLWRFIRNWGIIVFYPKLLIIPKLASVIKSDNDELINIYAYSFEWFIDEFVGTKSVGTPTNKKLEKIVNKYSKNILMLTSFLEDVFFVSNYILLRIPFSSLNYNNIAKFMYLVIENSTESLKGFDDSDSIEVNNLKLIYLRLVFASFNYNVIISHQPHSILSNDKVFDYVHNYIIPLLFPNLCYLFTIGCSPQELNPLILCVKLSAQNPTISINQQISNMLMVLELGSVSNREGGSYYSEDDFLVNLNAFFDILVPYNLSNNIFSADNLFDIFSILSQHRLILDKFIYSESENFFQKFLLFTYQINRLQQMKVFQHLIQSKINQGKYLNTYVSFLNDIAPQILESDRTAGKLTVNVEPIKFVEKRSACYINSSHVIPQNSITIDKNLNITLTKILE